LRITGVLRLLYRDHNTICTFVEFYHTQIWDLMFFKLNLIYMKLIIIIWVYEEFCLSNISCILWITIIAQVMRLSLGIVPSKKCIWLQEFYVKTFIDAFLSMILCCRKKVCCGTGTNGRTPIFDAFVRLHCDL
jgi:hypothetical protein